MNDWLKGLIICLIAICGVFLSASTVERSPKLSWTSNDVNLALRQVAHDLYDLACDSTSAIAPVKQHEDYVYSIRLECDLDYDALPDLMTSAVSTFHLPNDYQILIRDCNNEQVMLGYSSLFVSSDNVACQGRDQAISCSDLYLTLRPEPEESSLWSWILFTTLLGGIIGFLVYRWLGVRPDQSNLADVAKENAPIALGKFQFDPSNLSLTSDQGLITLTFRECKLLHYLVSHANTVLTRDDIQSNVWEDEGIIVGRSLDVFVSRLRKILKSDPSLQIKSIHGVGYRFEM